MAKFPTRTVRSCKTPGKVWSPNRRAEIAIPKGWVLVPTGDPGLTRRVRHAAETWWLLEEREQKANGSWGNAKAVGTYAPSTEVKPVLAAAGGKPRAGVKKAKASIARQRREERDVAELKAQVLKFLDFAKSNRAIAERIATDASSAAAIGSGKVGRTATIPVAERAELAARAHIRHEHTSYDATLDGARRAGAKRVTSTSKKYAAIRSVTQREVDEFLLAHRAGTGAKRRRR